MITPITLDTQTGGITSITKTAGVGSRIQPEEKQKSSVELQEELLAQRDTVQNQITTLKGIEGSDTTELEGKLSSISGEIEANSANLPQQQTALERLQGKTDTYAAEVREEKSAMEELLPKTEQEQEETLETSAEKSAENDVKDVSYDMNSAENKNKTLEKDLDDLELQASSAEKRGDDVAWKQLKDQIKSVQTQIDRNEEESSDDKRTTVVAGVKV